MPGRPKIWTEDRLQVTVLRLPLSLVQSFRDSMPAGHSLEMWISDLVIRALGEDPLAYRAPTSTEEADPALSDLVAQRRLEAEEADLIRRRSEMADHLVKVAAQNRKWLISIGASDEEFRQWKVEPPTDPGWPALQAANREASTQRGYEAIRRGADGGFKIRLERARLEAEAREDFARQAAQEESVSKASPESGGNSPMRDV